MTTFQQLLDSDADHIEVAGVLATAFAAEVGKGVAEGLQSGVFTEINSDFLDDLIETLAAGVIARRAGLDPTLPTKIVK